ncbi:putative UV-damaged DNA binding factor (ISS) protein [Corchorus olitorius]|uniref:UV-damaged DNA binding factor (ISS) protein n=1 Tax=Corchorus olitorius TaxID=93759 RepID=A0A1R3KKB1_9ROSI|nr:putative UV-damaged DNA binding factor (ISS) protein [Corchorus olitorius]
MEREKWTVPGSFFLSLREGSRMSVATVLFGVVRGSYGGYGEWEVRDECVWSVSVRISIWRVQFLVELQGRLFNHQSRIVLSLFEVVSTLWTLVAWLGKKQKEGNW